MEDELALPSQRDEEPAADDDDEEEAMSEGEDDNAAEDEPATGSPRPGDGSGEKLPAGKAPPTEASPANAANTDAKATPAPAAEAPRDGLLDTSGADATRPGSARVDGGWSNWSRAAADERQQASRGSVVRTSGPAEAVEREPSGDRREGAKLRSPAQQMVEGSERSIGRWRAKAAASGEATANPLRGVTAQPGNPLR